MLAAWDEREGLWFALRESAERLLTQHDLVQPVPQKSTW